MRGGGEDDEGREEGRKEGRKDEVRRNDMILWVQFKQTNKQTKNHPVSKTESYYVSQLTEN